MVNLQKGLVGHWTMDDRDTSGGILYDKSGYDNHGIVDSTIDTSQASPIGDSYFFDGTTPEDVYIQSSDGMTESSEMTICCWFNKTGQGDTQYPRLWGGSIETWSSTSENIVVRLNSNKDTSGAQVNVSTTFDQNDFGFFAQTYDSNRNPTLKTYKNGSFSDSNNEYYGNVTIDGISTISKSGREFKGNISDVRVYNRALSEEEVNALYQMRSPRSSKSSPIADYIDTQSWYNSNGHASTKSQLDEFFDTSNSGVNRLRTVVHERDSIYHGLGGQNSTFGTVNSEPYYFTQGDGYAWKVSGTLTAPESGTYSFGIDGDDAMDLLIDDTAVATFYGGHGFNGDVANHSDTITLTKGKSYDFVYRYEEGGGGSGGAVGWQKPSDSSWKLFPANILTQ